MVREISAEDLDAACRKCIRVEVSDMNALSLTLDEIKLEYNVVSETKADIFAQITVTELVLALAKKNCQVISIQEKDESLESYFMSLVGGADNE